MNGRSPASGMNSTEPEPVLDRCQERGEAGIEVNRRSPTEGGEDGRRDHVAAGGTTTTNREQAPRSDPPGRWEIVNWTPNGAAWRAHTDGKWAPEGGTLAAVWERMRQMRKVTRAGTTVFGARTSAEGRPLWDRRAKAVGISLWGSPRWLQFREMAGDGGTSRVSETERPAPMTSTDN